MCQPKTFMFKKNVCLIFLWEIFRFLLWKKTDVPRFNFPSLDHCCLLGKDPYQARPGSLISLGDPNGGEKCFNIHQGRMFSIPPRKDRDSSMAGDLPLPNVLVFKKNATPYGKTPPSSWELLAANLRLHGGNSWIDPRKRCKWNPGDSKCQKFWWGFASWVGEWIQGTTFIQVRKMWVKLGQFPKSTGWEEEICETTTCYLMFVELFLWQFGGVQKSPPPKKTNISSTPLFRLKSIKCRVFFQLTYANNWNDKLESPPFDYSQQPYQCILTHWESFRIWLFFLRKKSWSFGWNQPKPPTRQYIPGKKKVAWTAN